MREDGSRFSPGTLPECDCASVPHRRWAGRVVRATITRKRTPVCGISWLPVPGRLTFRTHALSAAHCCVCTPHGLLLQESREAQCIDPTVGRSSVI